MNLCLNARDAMPDGGRLSVRTEACLEPSDNGQSSISLAVEDTGTGMTETIKSRVFEPFFSTKERGSGSAWPSCGKSSRGSAKDQYLEQTRQRLAVRSMVPREERVQRRGGAPSRLWKKGGRGSCRFQEPRPPEVEFFNGLLERTAQNLQAAGHAIQVLPQFRSHPLRSSTPANRPPRATGGPRNTRATPAAYSCPLRG